MKNLESGIRVAQLLSRYQLYAVILFICMRGAIPGSALADEVDNFIDEIQRASDQVESFSSPFTQEKHLALFAQPVLFNGVLIVARPNRLRWEFNSPMSSILILDGETGLRCTGQEKPVSFDLASDPIMRGVAEQLWLWLGGDYVKLKNLYHLQVTDENTLVVSPKDNSVSDYISSVAITFDGTTRQPSTVEIVEPGGDLTRIIFRSYALNPSLSDSLFKKCTIDD